MATAVLDLDLQNLPQTITGLHNYDSAFVLIRFNKKPIGKKIVPVFKGQIIIEEHLKDIVDEVGTQLWKNWMYDYLDWDEKNIIDQPLPKATIAVCTRDRTEDLKRCLDGLMSLPYDGQEYIVVDNCPSNDATEILIASYSSVRYVRENKPGLNNARNRALLEATHEIVAFTDDDAVVDSNWLRVILQNFNNNNVGCVTGLTMPLELETKAQEVFEKYYSFGKGFYRRVFTNASGNPLSTGKIGAGANMALRKKIISEIGIFDEALDAGTPTQSGGDHEMFARILMAGYHIVYDPSALSWHRHRRTWPELRKTLYGYGVGVYSLLTRHLFYNRELSAFKIAFNWFWYDQLPAFLRSLFKRPNYKPMDLVLAELHGCLIGPWAYFSSKKRSKKIG